VYNQILRFVERDLSRIMDIAEKVSVGKFVSGSRVRQQEKGGVDVKGGLPLSTAHGRSPISSKMGREGFEIMTNVVWEEVGRAIMDELGNVVFSAGRPNEFRKVCGLCGTRMFNNSVNTSTMKQRKHLSGLSSFSRLRCNP
jgi:conserved oligomeric Golgi complex subunit 2